jgi:hypothetical protein
MAHALVANVNLEGRDVAEAEKVLNEEVIPAVKQAPGFQSGVWVRSQDGKVGMGVVVFDSEANAKGAEQAMPNMRPEGAPPITSIAVYEVTGQA